MMKSFPLLSSLTLLFLLSATGCHSDYAAGEEAAEKAIAEGNPIMETYGLLASGPDHYADTLRSYGVTLVVGDCAVDKTAVEHAEGVNAVTEKMLKEKYGDDIMERIRTEAAERKQSYLKALAQVGPGARQHARDAIAAGKPFVECFNGNAFGNVVTLDTVIRRQVMAKYGVEVVVIRAGADFRTAAAHMQAVNEVTEEWLKSKHGADVMTLIRAEERRLSRVDKR